jgi:hypothetical protein
MMPNRLRACGLPRGPNKRIRLFGCVPVASPSFGPDKPRGPQGLIGKGVNEPHRIVGANVVVHRLRQQQYLRTFESRNVCHALFYRVKRGRGIPAVRLSTQSARKMHSAYHTVIAALTTKTALSKTRVLGEVDRAPG